MTEQPQIRLKTGINVPPAGLTKTEFQAMAQSQGYSAVYSGNKRRWYLTKHTTRKKSLGNDKFLHDCPKCHLIHPDGGDC